jgi:WD40 repeat protein
MDTVSDLEMQLLPPKTGEVAVENSSSEKSKFPYILKTLEYLSQDFNVEKSIPVNGNIFRIATSKSRVVLATSNNDVYLLSDDMNSLRLLGSHSDFITQVLISEDQKYAITSSRDKSIKIFLLENPEDKPEFKAQEEQSDQPSYGKEDQEGPIKVWKLRANSAWVNGIRIASDGKTLYSCSKDGHINIWDLSEKTLKETFYEDRGSIFDMDFDSEFRMMVTGHKSGDVCVWDLNEKKVVNVLEGDIGKAICVKFTPDFKYIVIGYDDGNVNLWSFESQSQPTVLTGHSGEIRTILITQDSRYIISMASSEKAIKIWDIEEKKLKANLQGHSDDVVTIKFSPDEKYIISNSRDKTICIWSMQYCSLVATLTGHSMPVYATSIFKDNLLLSGGGDNCLKFWTYKREYSKSLEFSDNSIRSIQICEDNRHFYTVDDYMYIKYWDMHTGTYEKLFSGALGSPTSMIISKDKRELILGCNGSIEFFDIETRKIVHTIETEFDVNCLALTDDNRTLFAGGFKFYIYDNITKEKLGDYTSFHDCKICPIIISRDQTFFVTFSWDSTIKVWDLAERKVIKTLEGHTDCVTGGYLIKDDRYLVSISNDRTIRIWDLATGLEAGKLEGHDYILLTSDISSDGRYLVTGDNIGTILIWDLMTQTEILNFITNHNIVGKIKFSTDNQYLIIYDGNLQIIDTRDLFLNTSIKKENTDEEISIRGFKEVFLSSYYNNFITNKTDAYLPWMNNICVFPYKINILFFFAHSNEHQKLKIALEGGAPLIEDKYGNTPITVSLERNTSRCLDEMLKYIIKLHQVADCRTDVFLLLVSKDITKIILSGSRYLPQLLQALFVAVEDAELPSFAVPRFNLPYTTLQPNPEIRKETFIDEKNKGEGILIEYTAAKFAWNFEPGSTESLEFLKAVIESPNTSIYTNPLIKSILDFKWNYLWYINFALTIIYWISLAVLVSLVL